MMKKIPVRSMTVRGSAKRVVVVPENIQLRLFAIIELPHEDAPRLVIVVSVDCRLEVPERVGERVREQRSVFVEDAWDVGVVFLKEDSQFVADDGDALPLVPALSAGPIVPPRRIARARLLRRGDRSAQER